jgi:hypothetical protein
MFGRRSSASVICRGSSCRFERAGVGIDDRDNEELT